jgi:hypothetical protein
MIDLTALIAYRDRPENLAFCLASLAACDPAPRLVFVDYGSAEPAAPTVRRLVPWADVVRVETGPAMFHKARALNIGLRRVRSSWVCVTDADQVFARNFFGAVLASLKPASSRRRFVLCRTYGLKEVPPGVTPENVAKGYAGILKGLVASGAKPYGEGCCNAVSTEWAMAVHGLDEGYVGWGGEDSDFIVRAKKCGLELHRVEGATSTIHFPHVRRGDYYDHRKYVDLNRARYRQVAAGERVVANVGVDWGRCGPDRELKPGGPLVWWEGRYRDALEAALPGRRCETFGYPQIVRHGRDQRRAAAELELAFAKTQPAALVMYKDNALDARLLARLRLASPRTKMVLCYGDVRNHVTEDYTKRRAVLDAVMLTHTDQSIHTLFHKAGARHTGVYYGSADPDLIGPGRAAQSVDVFFGGSNYAGAFPLSGERRRLLQAVAARFKSLVVRGSGWDKIAKAGPTVKGSQYGIAMAQARVVLGINHYDVERYYSGRTVYATSSGRLHVTRYIPGMEADWKNHVDIVWFYTVEEAVDLIGYYLEHAEARERVAAAQRARAQAMFGAAANAARLLDMLRRIGP